MFHMAGINFLYNLEQLICDDDELHMFGIAMKTLLVDEDIWPFAFHPEANIIGHIYE